MVERQILVKQDRDILNPANRQVTYLGTAAADDDAKLLFVVPIESKLAPDLADSTLVDASSSS